MSKKETVSSTPNKLLKYSPALAAGAVLAIAAFAGTREGSSSDNEPKVQTPVVTTIYGAGTGGVWEAAENELIISGYANEEGSVPKESINDLTDKSMKLNVTADPNFKSDNLPVGAPIIVLDVPDKTQG